LTFNAEAVLPVRVKVKAPLAPFRTALGTEAETETVFAPVPEPEPPVLFEILTETELLVV